MDRKRKIIIGYGVLAILFVALAILVVPMGYQREYDYTNAKTDEAICRAIVCESDQKCITGCGTSAKCVGATPIGNTMIPGNCEPSETNVSPERTYYTTTYFCLDTYLGVLMLLSSPLWIATLLVSTTIFLKRRKLLIGLLILLLSITFIVAMMIFMQAESKKPAIYLYPEETMPVSVEVIPDAWFTKTIPAISNNRWDVIAHPSGEIEFEGAIYPYLFYESITYQNHDPPKGWSVPKADVVGWFNEYLPKMGLNEQETKDFVDYWSVNLPNANYYTIRMVNPQDYDRSAHLTITPTPDTLIRVILRIDPTDQQAQIEEPLLVTPVREGFTAVEWGVLFA